VTLIGHSAGAIYLQRFVEAFDEAFTSQPKRQVEIITLAAAVSFGRMNNGLSAIERRASGVRLFGLSGSRQTSGRNATLLEPNATLRSAVYQCRHCLGDAEESNLVSEQ
jgi:hypothetical protein